MKETMFAFNNCIQNDKGASNFPGNVKIYLKYQSKFINQQVFILILCTYFERNVRNLKKRKKK